MPPKRKNGGEAEEESTTARDRKKQRLNVSRTIAVQQNATAGPSGVNRSDSLTGLPATLDVVRFAEARSFEINAMEEAMHNARGAGTQRAWQELPRHLRRRAASHDVRRVPVRLRGKAQGEMDTPQKPAKSRSISKRGKATRESRTADLLRRQRDKTWLETHIWHAKRMHMENMWGYRLAITPTEKAFRPSHRASVHGSIIHDASYYSVIELKGSEEVLSRLLERCCDPEGPGPGSQRFTGGTRVLNTHLYKHACYPYDLIAPASVLWKPLPAKEKEPEPASQTRMEFTTRQSKKTKKKSGAKGNTQAATQSPELHTGRTVWLRSHPAVFDDVWATVQASASFTLETFKGLKDAKGRLQQCHVEIIDLRDQLVAFEIMGPKSSQIIKGALTPVWSQKRPEFKKFWHSLANLQSAGSVPHGMIIGFTIQDPRLNFPPKNAKVAIDQGDKASLPAIDAHFPCNAIAQSDIWATEERDDLKKPRFKKKDIDSRKSGNLIPGTSLNPLPSDNRVPILLIQRSVESPPSEANGSGSSTPMHGWTLIAPAGWGMPIFSSLTYTGSRVGGQRERHVQAFEAGAAYFPRDYPSTPTYDSEAARRAEEEKSRWERTPPAKRVNYAKLGTLSPWKADWELVLGLNPSPPPAQEDDLLAAQREDAMEIVQPPAVRPWLFRGAEICNIIDKVLAKPSPSGALLEEIDRLRAKRGYPSIGERHAAGDLWKGALVNVRISVVARGAPNDLAMIYRAEDEDVKNMGITVEHLSGAEQDPDEDDVAVQYPEEIPATGPVIGYVTCGNFSLSRGHGYAIGCIALAQMAALKEQSTRLQRKEMFVSVRDRRSVVPRLAHLELLKS